MDRFLNDYCNLFQALLSAILQNEQIPELQLLLQRLEKSPGWRWHLQQNSTLGFDADISRILLHLYTSSLPPQPGRSGRNDLVKQQLPKALFADLKEAIAVFAPPQDAVKKTKAVIFLDGFEALIKILGEFDAQCLLEMLTINQFKDEEAYPLLLVVGSRKELLEMTGAEHSYSFEDFTLSQDEQIVKQHTAMLYEHWQKHLPMKKPISLLKDILLPHRLLDFGLDDTRVYLKHFGEKVDIQVFAND